MALNLTDQGGIWAAGQAVRRSARIGAAPSGRLVRRFQLTIEVGPRVSDGLRLVLALVGGLFAACGAKFVKGCTSGQALAFSSMLNAVSLSKNWLERHVSHGWPAA